jgi:regulator of sigma E protease
MQITPRFDKQTGRNLIGVRVSEGEVRRVRYAPGAAFQKGLEKSWEYTTMIFDVIGKMASRKVSANNLSGPLGIIPVSGFLALQGISQILNFMALIGINLAVLNLLPLVITDGGLLLFLLIEAIRRKPLQVKRRWLLTRLPLHFFCCFSCLLP